MMRACRASGSQKLAGCDAVAARKLAKWSASEGWGDNTKGIYITNRIAASDFMVKRMKFFCFFLFTKRRLASWPLGLRVARGGADRYMAAFVCGSGPVWACPAATAAFCSDLI